MFESEILISPEDLFELLVGGELEGEHGEVLHYDDIIADFEMTLMDEK